MNHRIMAKRTPQVDTDTARAVPFVGSWLIRPSRTRFAMVLSARDDQPFAAGYGCMKDGANFGLRHDG